MDFYGRGIQDGHAIRETHKRTLVSLNARPPQRRVRRAFFVRYPLLILSTRRNLH